MSIYKYTSNFFFLNFDFNKPKKKKRENNLRFKENFYCLSCSCEFHKQLLCLVHFIHTYICNLYKSSSVDSILVIQMYKFINAGFDVISTGELLLTLPYINSRGKKLLL
jgi:hypothetical protein